MSPPSSTRWRRSPTRSRRPSWRDSISWSPRSDGSYSSARCSAGRSAGGDRRPRTGSGRQPRLRWWIGSSEKDLIRPAAGDSFAFRHILIREVAYQTLLRAERAELHAAAARRLEGRAAGREDALAELIAYHFREAATLTARSETAPLDVDEIRRKAVGWLKRAADVAAAGAATAEAARHLRAAIELAPTDDLPDLQERLGDVSGRDGGGGGVPGGAEALPGAGPAGRSGAAYPGQPPHSLHAVSGDGRETGPPRGASSGSAGTAGRSSPWPVTSGPSRVF